MATKTKKESLINRAFPAFPEAPEVFQDRIVIIKKKPETQSAGGIYIPSTAITEENKGYVVAVGPLVGKFYAGNVVPEEFHNKIPHVGDYVLFGEYAGTEVEFKGEKFLIVKEADILSKI